MGNPYAIGAVEENLLVVLAVLTVAVALYALAVKRERCLAAAVVCLGLSVPFLYLGGRLIVALLVLLVRDPSRALDNLWFILTLAAGPLIPGVGMLCLARLFQRWPCSKSSPSGEPGDEEGAGRAASPVPGQQKAAR